MKEELQHFSYANSHGVIDVHVELQHRLSSEIALATTALKKAEEVLLQRYAKVANSHGFHALSKRLQWGTTRSRFEQCLRNVRKHLDCILALIGAKQL